MDKKREDFTISLKDAYSTFQYWYSDINGEYPKLTQKGFNKKMEEILRIKAIISIS
jgi:hypothetical protein